MKFGQFFCLESRKNVLVDNGLQSHGQPYCNTSRIHMTTRDSYDYAVSVAGTKDTLNLYLGLS
jgi:hypothetical protein